MSSRASAALFIPGVSTSPFISWRTGSIWISLHTIFSISASKSRSSLCLWIMKPPRLHIVAWSTSKTSPHAQVDGVSLICQSYLRWMASLNSLLFSVKSTSLTGMTVSQLDAPFSAARSAALLVCSGRAFFTSSRSSLRRASLSLRLHCCSVLIAWSSGSSCVCATICSTSGPVIAVEASYFEAAIWHGFVIPRPPILTGNASKSRSASVQVCPAIAGIRAWLMERSSGSRRSSISGNVLK